MAEPKKPERRTPANPWVAGPTKLVDVTQPTVQLRPGVPETTRPVPRAELVTDGMKAHRREIERRKRLASIEKLQVEQLASDTRKQIWKWTFRAVVLLVAFFAYRRLQDSYGNQWPIWDVWVLLGIGLFGGIAWIIWYLNRQDM